ncbi:hypothetical protein GCM10023238_27690 [Streptomyces heliomycini]
MKAANRSGARYALVLGERDLAEGVVQLKDMESGEQSAVGVNEIVAEHGVATRVTGRAGRLQPSGPPRPRLGGEHAPPRFALSTAPGPPPTPAGNRGRSVPVRRASGALVTRIPAPAPMRYRSPVHTGVQTSAETARSRANAGTHLCPHNGEPAAPYGTMALPEAGPHSPSDGIGVMSKTTVRDVDMEPEPSAAPRPPASVPRTEGAGRPSPCSW